MSPCSLCSKVANDSDSVTCDICRKPVHNVCAGLSKPEVDCLKPKRRELNFSCDKCDIISTINDLKQNILELKTELEELKNNKLEVRKIDGNSSSEGKFLQSSRTGTPVQII